MNITNQASKQTMREALQDEIDKCRTLIARLSNSTNTWGSTVASLMLIDIEAGEKALSENDDSAMFKSLRSLRINNTANS